MVRFSQKVGQQIADQSADAQGHDHGEKALNLCAGDVSEDQADAQAITFAPVTALMAELE